ncbi:hypothetical protein CW706_03755 [Candidatus Bathyarchaeota archaeon]|nr:MAG: hypothetical protein CW706_03755 [Candidatus Bathyarchaeota archaeon]
MYILGLDVGTTGCKSIIFSPDGRIVSSAYGEYKLYHRRIEWSELNPYETWNTAKETIRRSIENVRIRPEEIAALSTSVLGEAFIPVDEKGNPLYWSMTTFDARAVEQTRWWEEKFGADEIYRITGQPLTSSMPIYPLPKIQWLREYEPKVYEKTWKFLCWEEYVNMKLCGKPVTDFSVASRTMMFDITRKKWSGEILDVAGIDEDLLPEAAPSGVVIGHVSPKASEETGLSEETLIVTGGHDQPCGALGAGLVESGPAMDATGTVECIGVVLDRPVLNERLRRGGFAVHHYVIEDIYFLFGFNPTSGVILRWFRDNFAEGERMKADEKGVNVYEILMSLAAESPPGARGLFFLPYFEGSGTPTFNRKARGVILGLTLSHKKSDVLRAILEGLSYELRRNIEAIERNGTKISEVRAIGGGAQSDFWLQIKADITGRLIVAPKVTEAASLGAAILAGVGSRVYESIKEAVRRIYAERAKFIPQTSNVEKYGGCYGLYKRIYDALAGIFDEI